MKSQAEGNSKAGTKGEPLIDSSELCGYCRCYYRHDRHYETDYKWRGTKGNSKYYGKICLKCSKKDDKVEYPNTKKGKNLNIS